MTKLFFHDWNKWSDPVDTLNGGHKQQWRVCKCCNKAQFRTLEWDKQVSLSSVLEAVSQSRGDAP